MPFDKFFESWKCPHDLGIPWKQIDDDGMNIFFRRKSPFEQYLRFLDDAGEDWIFVEATVHLFDDSKTRTFRRSIMFDALRRCGNLTHRAKDDLMI